MSRIKPARQNGSKPGLRLLLCCLLCLLVFPTLACDQLDIILPVLEQIAGTIAGDEDPPVDEGVPPADEEVPPLGEGVPPADEEVTPAALPVDTTLFVPGNYSTIQEAIDESSHGDVIMVAPGRYKENIDFKGHNITLTSTDPADPSVVASTVIDGNNSGTVVTFQSGESAEAILIGFTITGGNAGARDGGGISISGYASPQIRGNTITGNMARYGAGAHVTNESGAVFINNTFSTNSATSRLGAAIYVTNQSTVTIESNTFTDHVGMDGVIRIGSSYSDQSQATISANTIHGNRAEGSGTGGIKVTAESGALIENNQIYDNTGMGDYNGGAISIRHGANVVVRNNQINDNTAERAGAIAIRGARAEIIDNNIDGNHATHRTWGQGGGIFISQGSDVLIENNTITNNRAERQAGRGSGGGIWVLGSETRAMITQNIISGNFARRSGGGISISSTTRGLVIITQNTISENRTEDGDHLCDGGGVALVYSGEATIYDNVLSNNYAEGRGGGIFVAPQSSVYDGSGTKWPRLHHPLNPEPNNTYEGNRHGYYAAPGTGHNVFFE